MGHGLDATLTLGAPPVVRRVSEAPAHLGRVMGMTEDGVDAVVRRAIGGDLAAMAWIAANSDVSADATVLAMGALLQSQASRLDRALTMATSRRDRKIVAIARAHLDSDSELVDALARDHLVDFPDSYIVAWLASGAVVASPSSSPGESGLDR
jgi:hypothetical protein